jgi:hypothetical protein
LQRAATGFDLTADRKREPNEPYRRGIQRLRAGPLPVAILAFAFQLPIFDRWFSVMDEGHMLQFADIVADGGMLYRDATSYPLPGAFYLLALAFRIFEPSILLSRWIVVLEFTGLAVLAFLLLRRLVSPAYAALGIAGLLLYRVWAFPHWQMYSYSTTALLVLTASLLALVRFLETGDRRVLAVAGLIFGLGVFCKQDYGAATLLAVSFTLVVYARSGPRELRKPLLPLFAAFLGPAALVGAAAGVHFWMQGQLALVIQLTVLNHFVGLSSYDYQSFPSLLPLFQQDPALRSPVGLYNNFPAIVSTSDGRAALESALFVRTALYDTAMKAFIYGPNLFILGGALRTWKIRSALATPGERDRALTEIALFSFAAAFVLLMAVYKPQDYVHLAVLYWPLLCLAVAYAHALLRGRRGLTWLCGALLLFPAAVALGYTGKLLWKFREIHSERVPGDRAGVLARPREARLMGEIVDYIRANSSPGDRVAAMPYFPIAQFLADRDAPHAASYIVWPFPEYPDREQRIIAAMEESNTSLILYNFTQFPNFPPVPAYAPDLFDYLVDHFETDRVFNDAAFGYKLAALRRQRPLSDGRIVFGAAASEGTLRVETPAGTAREIPEREREHWIEAASWPFRPVLAIRPTAGGRRTVLSIPVEVPAAGAALRTAVGVHPDFWFRYPPSWARFGVEVVSDADRRVLFDRTLDPHQVLEDRGWFDVDVPLDAWAGRRITLELATSTALPLGESRLMGGWGTPTLVVRNPGEAP